MKGDTRLERRIGRRVDVYRVEAETRALAALDEMQTMGIRAWLVGSLARGRFTIYSDVDFLVDGGRDEWTQAVTIIERCMGHIPIDVVSCSRISDTERDFMLPGALDASRLRSRIRKADAACDRSPEAVGG
jgi:predicted nucleotidyltransferase